MCRQTWMSFVLALWVMVGGAGCGKDTSRSGGKAKGSGDAQLVSGSGLSPKRHRPGGLDCRMVVAKQEMCVDALVKWGGEEMVKSIRARIDKLPAGQRQQRLAALEQTRKQIGKLMRQQLVGPDVLATCRARFGGGRGLSAATARAARQLKVCLAMTDCGALARCYWKLLGAQRVGGVPGR